MGCLGSDRPELRRDQGEGDGLKRLALTLLFLFIGCSSTESATSPSGGTTTGTDAGIEDDASSSSSGGDASSNDASSSECNVTAVPDAVKANLSLDTTFYAKHVFVGPLSIVSSTKVPDHTLCVAKDVVTHMLEERPQLLERLVEKKIRLAIMSETEVTTDIPEHATLSPKEYWDERARGLGATLDRPAVSAAEENVLCYATDRYKGESILVHELSHAIFNIAIELYEPSMKPRLQAAFDAAIAGGKYANTYAATNTDEYWAEGVQDWFDTNITVSPANGIHNEIGTRAQLKTYDPMLSVLISEVFGDRPWRYACPSK